MAEGVRYKGLESLSLGDTNLSLRTRYSVWFLQSPNPYCMGFRRVYGGGNCRSCKENGRGFCRTGRGFSRGIRYLMECD